MRGAESGSPSPSLGPISEKLAERDQKDPSTVDAAKLASARTEAITVPAGKFEARAVKIDDAKQGVSGTIWFSADVPNGMVKMKLHFKGAKQDVAAELLTISRGKAKDAGSS